MPNNQGHIAITSRIDLLRSKWKECTSRTNTRLCRWLIEDDEYRMIQAFVEIESTEEGSLPDLFIRFDIPFQSKETFELELINELKKQINEDAPFLEEEGIIIKMPENHDSTFPAYFSEFGESIEDMDGHIVAWINPFPIADIKEWMSWLEETIKADIPNNMKLMVVDSLSQPLFKELCTKNEETIETIIPELNMDQAIEQINATTGIKGPGKDFGDAFSKASSAGQKGKIEKFEKHAQEALKIARSNEWKDLEVATYLLQGNVYYSQARSEKSLSSYKSAQEVAGRMIEAEEAMGPGLMVQALFAEAAMLFPEKKMKEAGALYYKAYEVCQERDMIFQEFESMRMLAYCQMTIKNNKEANTWNFKALDFLEVEVNKPLKGGEQSVDPLQTSGLYVVDALLKLNYKNGNRDNELNLRAKAESIFGTDWEETLAQFNKKQVV